jgi:hypothetical protein
LGPRAILASVPSPAVRQRCTGSHEGEMPQLRKGHYTWGARVLTWLWSLFDVEHVSNRHLVFDQLLAFCSFWLVSSVSNRQVSPLAHTWLSGVVHV